MESKIDLSQVTPVNYKVTVVLVNQFAVTTIQFLNRFSAQCEEKLRIVRDGIYRINTGNLINRCLMMLVLTWPWPVVMETRVLR
jgi:hypothetical protein